MDEIRAQADALIIGSRTIIQDNPNVTVKHSPELSPIPVCICRTHLPDRNSRFFQGNRNALVFASNEIAIPEDYPGEIVVARREDLGPSKIAEQLVARGKKKILLEGGPTLAGAFFAENLIDKIFLTLVPWIIGGGSKPALAPLDFEPTKFRLSRSETIDDEIFMEYSRR